MKKKMIAIVAVVLVCVCLLCACSSSKSYTYNVATGDTIEVELDSSGGWSLKNEDGNFIILKDNEVISRGTFLDIVSYEGYEYIVSLLDTYQEVSVGKYSGFYYEVEGDSGMEYNYMLRMTDNTAVVVGSLAGSQDAHDAMSRLTLTVQ